MFLFAIPVLFAASVAFLEVTNRMYFRSVENASADAQKEFDETPRKEGDPHDLVRYIRILNKHYEDNDRNWRWRKRK